VSPKVGRRCKVESSPGRMGLDGPGRRRLGGKEAKAIYGGVQGPGQFDVHPNQITEWKRQVLEAMPGIFGRRKAEDAKASEQHEARLYEQVGKLQVELEWMKKKLGSLALTTEAKRKMVQRDSRDIPVVRQCELLRLPRSSLYYRPQREAESEAFEQRLLNAIDELYTPAAQAAPGVSAHPGRQPIGRRGDRPRVHHQGAAKTRHLPVAWLGGRRQPSPPAGHRHDPGHAVPAFGGRTGRPRLRDAAAGAQRRVQGHEAGRRGIRRADLAAGRAHAGRADRPHRAEPRVPRRVRDSPARAEPRRDAVSQRVHDCRPGSAPGRQQRARHPPARQRRTAVRGRRRGRDPGGVVQRPRV